MSVCNSCPDPGHCCKRFVLNLHADNEVEFQVKLEKHNLPFTIGEYVPKFKSFVMSCPLLVNGRCSDYANRPQVCISYQPGTDSLCVLPCLTKEEPTWTDN